MGEIIDFPEKNDVSFRYISDMDQIGLIVDSDLGDDLSITKNGDVFEVCIGYTWCSFEREKLAEFLQAAAIFIDSERRYLPEVELVAVDY